jgi:hypothetical protein
MDESGFHTEFLEASENATILCPRARKLNLKKPVNQVLSYFISLETMNSVAESWHSGWAVFDPQGGQSRKVARPKSNKFLIFWNFYPLRYFCFGLNAGLPRLSPIR